MSSIKSVLDDLKNQLDENFTRHNPDGILDEEDKEALREQCIFEDPTNLSAIDSLEREIGITIPKDYREFLLIHNGMTLFKSYLVSFRFYSLKEIKENFIIVQEDREEMELDTNNDYPIGIYPDVGYIMVDGEKVNLDSSHGAIYVSHISPEETEESFVSFVEKLIETSGDFFWEDSNLPEY